jgi:hypothetical protein
MAAKEALKLSFLGPISALFMSNRPLHQKFDTHVDFSMNFVVEIGAFSQFHHSCSTISKI